MPRTLRVLPLAAALVAGTIVIRGSDIVSTGDAELQFQIASVLFDENRYDEAIAAFDRAAKADDPALSVRARKGKVRAELRIAEFAVARTDAETLRRDVPLDPEAATLYGDSLWAAGLFDESDQLYQDALNLNPESSRARFGRARSMATRNRLDEALNEALAASAAAPRDAEIHHAVGQIYERMNRFDEAANAYMNYINLLPNRDRSEKAAWSRAQVRFLKAFEGKVPVSMDEETASRRHTVPFRLVDDKVIVQGRVNGERLQDFVLDTGSEEIVLSRQTAQRAGVHPITYTLSAGVGEVGLRGLQLGRLDSLEIGTMKVHNLPVLIKSPALRGLPKREGESFSPLALGLSMMIDYQRRQLTLARDLPVEGADFTLPMRVHRLAMVRGMLNDQFPAYFVIDTGGEVISISAELAESLTITPRRRIPLKVYGTSGWDRDAFLLPGVNLNFDAIEYRNFPVVVLNLRAPSVLLGFRVGGIVGHKFLGNYRVAMDLERSELRLAKY
ncbi:MAG TPA: aspartyl protease family protein [Vicinamibacterales bacterium]|jgi:tetratricopeptide (TPR) repeat protein|nr:aspartyl protease family protein [Vicinamibacterales bacterium]